MTELERQLEQTIRQRNLFRPGQSILVAVSGGVDSMVLLHGLHQLLPRYRWKLTVAHLNHQLRGRSSDVDQRLVQKTAAALALPFETEVVDVRAAARERKVSIEMAARTLRHEFLARVAARRKIRTLAVAHHADDQVELFFLRLFRGTSGEGLSGMQWRNPSPVDRRLEIVRPLLDQPKTALAHYASERGVPFREDATNTSLNIQRNRIRMELLPLLRSKYQSALSRTVLRAMEVVGAEAEFVSTLAIRWLQAHRGQRAPRQAAQWGNIAAVPFDELPDALQRKIIQSQLLELGLGSDFELIEQLRRKPGQAVSVTLPNSPLATPKKSHPATRRPAVVPNSVTCDKGGIVRVQKAIGERFKSVIFEVDLRQANKASFEGVYIAWHIKNGAVGRRPPKVAGAEWFDAEQVGPLIQLRHWRPGDRFQPIGMAQPVKLQDLFTNAKIPRSKRHQLLLGLTHDGQVFWVEGLRIAERFKLTGRTIRRLHWQWQRL